MPRKIKTPKLQAFIKKTCQKCKKYRKFMIGTKRDRTSICGECWDWKLKQVLEEMEG